MAQHAAQEELLFGIRNQKFVHKILSWTADGSIQTNLVSLWMLAYRWRTNQMPFTLCIHLTPSLSGAVCNASHRHASLTAGTLWQPCPASSLL